MLKDTRGTSNITFWESNLALANPIHDLDCFTWWVVWQAAVDQTIQLAGG